MIVLCMEFVSHLRSIFERFRLHNLFLKASKCKFGYSELEFVGKLELDFLFLLLLNQSL